MMADEVRKIWEAPESPNGDISFLGASACWLLCSLIVAVIFLLGGNCYWWPKEQSCCCFCHIRGSSKLHSDTDTSLCWRAVWWAFLCLAVPLVYHSSNNHYILKYQESYKPVPNRPFTTEDNIVLLDVRHLFNIGFRLTGDIFVSVTPQDESVTGWFLSSPDVCSTNVLIAHLSYLRL